MKHEFAIPLPDRRADVACIDESGSDASIVGTSGGLKWVMHQVEQVAPTAATVLLLGETGTGKALVARAIHRHSPRRHRRFVVVDCGALPATLIESELFGHERGAFTGAHASQAGRFEVASGGTIFLDEIGELPPELQPKLLRVLQEGVVERVGSPHPVRVDVRIIAATNRNLADEVRAGRFRSDLYYRINVFPITLPPLRQRRDDLPEMVHHLSERLGRKLGRPVGRIAAGFLQALERHQWPGNVRELENVLQQAIILSRDGVLDLSGFAAESVETIDTPRLEVGQVRPMIDAERDHLRLMLEHTRWRIEGPAGAAQLLGLHPSTLRSKMRKLGIARPRTEEPESRSPLTSRPGAPHPTALHRHVWAPPSQQAC
jgi:transcriptional regulator with GAF, ATPase, and Fis domain